MNKKIILASLFISCIALPAMAGEWPSDQDAYVLANTTYNKAAISDNMDGVTEGAVNANAWYNLTPGYYLPANSATAVLCEAGYACPGGNYTISSTDQGKNICGTSGYSNATGANVCQSCSTGYSTSDSGATNVNMCKKTVTFNGFGKATGSLTSSDGTIEPSDDGAVLVCTEDQGEDHCYLPDARKWTIEGWTLLGGWAYSMPSQNCTATYVPGTVAQSGQYFPCMRPTVYTLALVNVGNNNVNASEDETFKQGTGTLYYQYYENVFANNKPIIKGVYKTRTESDGIIGVDDNVTSGSTISIPEWPGRTFYGYYTEPGGAGMQAFDGNGEVMDHWLNNFEDGTSSLYGYWSDIENCPAGTVYNSTYNNCLPCPIGYYCPGGKQEAQVCQENTYSDETGASECKSCSAGYVIADNGQNAENHDAQSDCYTFVTLNRNGGTGSLPKQSVQNATATGTSNGDFRCYYGQNCSLPDTHEGLYVLSEVGQTFTGGWGTDGSCSSSNREFSHPVSGTYYACKSVNQITINWTGVATTAGGSGAKGAKQTSVSYGGDIETPAAAMNPNTGNQTFLGWKFQKPQSN